MAFRGFSEGRRLRVRLRVVAVVAVLGVLLAGFLPGWVKSALHEQGRLHGAGHVVAFVVLGALLNRTSRHRRVRLLLLIASVVLGYATEFAEHLVFNMMVEWKDVAVNGSGALLGAAMSEAAFRLRRQPR